MREAAFKVSLIQMDSQADEQRNMERAKELLEQAVRSGASLAVFPETVDYIGRGIKEHAKKIPGPWDAFFSEQAKRHGIYIHGGSITQKYEGGNPYNTSLMFAPDGACIGMYQKLHMFDVKVEDGPDCRESDDITPGNEIVLVDTGLARFGLSICYDLRFPEHFRLMGKSGASVLIVAANFTKVTGRMHWEPLLRARAIENTCYVLACGQCGEKPAFTANGHSMIIDPLGGILAEAGDEEGLVTGTIDLDVVLKARAQIPSLQNVREDVYRLESEHICVKNRDRSDKK